MRTIKNFAMLTMVIAASVLANPAHANPKPSSWFWSEGPIDDHWKNLDFIPHLEDAKHPQNSQWDHVTPWKPDDWIAQRESSMTLVQGFYDSDVLRKQYMNRGVPMLVVGPGFYKLGGYDKRRVAQTLDQVYQITSSAPDATFLIKDWTGKPVGAYTKYGLQLQ